MRVRKQTQGLGHSSMTVPAEIIRGVGSTLLFSSCLPAAIVLRRGFEFLLDRAQAK